METKTIEIEITRSGRPAAWEKGGGNRNTGYAQIIAGQNGEPKKPVYIRRRGELSNGDHSLFVISPGDIIIQSNHHRKDFCIQVFKIEHIDLEEKLATLTQLAYYEMGEWDVEPAENLLPAINASIEKSTCYHCRSPHYVSE